MHPIEGVRDNPTFKQKQRRPQTRSFSSGVCVFLCDYGPLVKAEAALHQTECCQNTVIAVMTERGIKSHQIYFHGPPKGKD